MTFGNQIMYRPSQNTDLGVMLTLTDFPNNKLWICFLNKLLKHVTRIIPPVQPLCPDTRNLKVLVMVKVISSQENKYIKQAKVL